jgi:DNA mismatch repair ATPase MutS
VKNTAIQFKSLRRGGNSIIEHLIELPVSVKVPSQWILINSTKTFHRYHTPKVLELQDRLLCAKDELKLELKSSWDRFLITVDSELHDIIRKCIKALAALDVLQVIEIDIFINCTSICSVI